MLLFLLASQEDHSQLRARRRRAGLHKGGYVIEPIAAETDGLFKLNSVRLWNPGVTRDAVVRTVASQHEGCPFDSRAQQLG